MYLVIYIYIYIYIYMYSDQFVGTGYIVFSRS